MSKSKELKWHEEIFTGVISAIFGLVFLFNGFNYLVTFFLDENGLQGKPTKQKGIVAFASLLESGWWKYLIVFVFLFVAFFQVRTGIRKFKSKKE